MRLLLIAQHFYPEMVSTGLHMTELTTRWKARHPEREFTIFTAQDAKTDQQAPSFQVHKGLNIHRVQNLGRQHGSLPQRILFSVRFMVRAFGFVFSRRHAYDLILITTNPPFLGILMLLLQPFSRLPFVLIAYDIYPQILTRMGILRDGGLVARLWQRLNVSVYNRAERVIAIGEDMRRIILEEMRIRRPERVELIHNWSDRHTVHPVP
ncbi:MAG: glycosyltransferase, partial [Rhodothermales bacterium]